MIVTIASGKGGTGKTTVATNLALVAASGRPGTRLLDCDVEEPNCHVFLKPTITRRVAAEVMVPKVDAEACTRCGLCGEICEYSAIVSLGTEPLVFPELCHSCLGCLHVCPEKAISEGTRQIGEIEIGHAGPDDAAVEFYGGRLRIGEAQAPPLIRQVKQYARPEGLTIIDAPPGSSCPVVECVRDSDFVILVTEPTPFGLNDLELAVEMVRLLGRPFGVVINRADIGDGRVREWCRAGDVPLLLEIPDDRRVAEAYSRGRILVDAVPGYADRMRVLLAEVEGQVTS